MAGEYLVLPKTFYSDMKYLHDNGFQTVTTEETLYFSENGGDFPEKPVMITFDDGFLNNLTYCLPILEEFDMTAVINIVGSYSLKSESYDDHNPSYAYLTPDEIIMLSESGRFEIGSHTFDMHSLDDRKGSKKKENETSEEYKINLTKDTESENGFFLERCNLVTDIFAYPYGFISDESTDILCDNGYKIFFTCYEKHNYITSAGKETPLFLDRYNRAYGLDTEAFMEKCNIV